MITSSSAYGVQSPPQQTQTSSSPEEESTIVLGQQVKEFKAATPELRVINEKRELEENILKLSEFILSEKFDTLSEDHRYLLAKQQNIMQDYSDVLSDRILLFTNEKNRI
jgi:hypothetical protein